MPKPTNREFARIFDTAASRYDEMTNPYAVRRRREFFSKYANGDVFEVGAGSGEVSRALKDAGHRVVATDISPNMVEEIKRKDIEAYVCDSETLPFPDASFDTVISSEHLYYLDHPEKFIDEAQRILRPKGRLLISSANHTTRFYDRLRAGLRIFGFGGMYFDDKNRSFMTEQKIKKLLAGNGFRILRTEKAVVLPAGFLNFANRILEKTPFRHAAIFIFVYAEKVRIGSETSYSTSPSRCWFSISADFRTDERLYHRSIFMSNR